MNKGLHAWPKNIGLDSGEFALPTRTAEQFHFIPDVVADVAAWWDASDYSSLTITSGAVSQWNDLSGGGANLTQGTAGQRPAYGTRAINNILVPDFDGTDDSLVTTTFALPIRPFSWAIVLETDTFGNRDPWGSNTQLANRHCMRARADGPSLLRQTSVDATSLLGWDNTGPVVVAASCPNGTIEFRVNEWNSYFVDASNGVANDGHRIGASGTVERHDGSVGEHIVWTRALSPSELDVLVAWLMWKWRIPTLAERPLNRAWVG